MLGTSSIIEFVKRNKISPEHYAEDNSLISTFQISIAEFISGGYFNGFDEESTTGGLLGAFGATAPWCSALYGINPKFGWIRYPKSGGSTISESATGSDFAIILKANDTTARLAVFQAKRVDESKNTFQIHQISPSGADEESIPEPQFLRLRDYGREILQTLGRNEIALPKMDWIHYLAYRNNSINCVPISDLSDIDLIYQSRRVDAANAYRIAYAKAAKAAKAIRKNKGDPSKVLNSAFRTSLMRSQWADHGIKGISRTENTVHLATLMTIGASGKVSEPAGWLEISAAEEARTIVEAIRAQMDVYESIGVDGPTPTLEDAFTNWSDARDSRRTSLKADVVSEVTSELANSNNLSRRLRP
ncbi:hypothetical protein [Stenotrophomonas sp.]|uniref:hypothetical protein n=1 Tax=Stenotrophomonas sp. TaxID=69392 RepID=UPI0028AABF72|nr:hypothetical protein [Stenotrophomonas sp.]